MDISDISKTSQNNIPDAKYYLIRPKDSSIIFVIRKKPDYKEEPFYNSCKGCKLDMENYLTTHSLSELNLENTTEGYYFLSDLGICPDENSVSYIFNDPAEAKVDVFEVLTSIDTFSVDKEVARYYKIFDWHILTLLNNEPFKSYIQEHLDEFKIGGSKAPSALGPTKESKGTPVILNKRLLI